MILLAVFVKAREELEGRRCFVKVVDMDKKLMDRRSLTLQRLSIPAEERKAQKISQLFYAVYGYLPSDMEFWAYDITCDISLP